MMHIVLFGLTTLLNVQARTLTESEKATAPAFRFFSHFHDGVVLQRGGLGSTIAGYAPKGSAVSTSSIPGFPPQTVLAGADGRWSMVLPPVPASTSPVSLVFTNAVKPGAPPIATAYLHDVLWGDVFLCSGQSNMGLSIEYVQPGLPDNETAIAETKPHIRLLSVASVEAHGANSSATALDEVLGFSERWISAPDAVTAENFSSFSAVCWLSGRKLHDVLAASDDPTPIGLILSSWGGTTIQLWSPPESLAACNGTEGANAQPAPRAGHTNPHFNGDGGLYNSMIAPFNTVTLAGVFWYQGEANAHSFPGATSSSTVPPPTEYRCALQQMIRGWQDNLRSGYRSLLPVIFAQLHPYCDGVKYCGVNATRLKDRELALPTIRDAQRRVGKTLHHSTVMAVCADLGDTALPLGPIGQVHPRCKDKVGDRLAAGALQLIYNRSDYGRSPTPLGATLHPGGVVRVSVEDAGHGLSLRPPPHSCPGIQGVPYQPVFCNAEIGFELHISPGGWKPASNVTVGQNYVDVSLTSEAWLGVGDVEVLGVRYGHTDWPILTVYAGTLPLSPFGELDVVKSY